jgi:uncharacterized protein
MNGGISFFDCNVRLGRANNPRNSKVWDIEGLQNHMEYFGIDNALVFHNEALRSPVEGNELLIKEIEKSESLYGCGVLVPSWTRELGNPKEYVRSSVDTGIRAFRLFPKVNNFTFAPFSLSPILDAVSRYNLPILVDYTNPADLMIPYTTWGFSPDYRAIHDAAAEFPEIPFIILIPGMISQRDQYAILASRDNVYLECSSFAYRFIEEVCDLFSPERLIFGSHTPQLDPGLAISYIMYAEIPESAKQKIAGENLKHLLGAVHAE